MNHYTLHGRPRVLDTHSRALSDNLRVQVEWVPVNGESTRILNGSETITETFTFFFCSENIF